MAVCWGLLILALGVAGQELPSGRHGCTDGSCYPATGNLLIGRSVNLTASSTCGLTGPVTYCIVSHLQESDKCFQCDSRLPYHPSGHRVSHRVDNTISLKDGLGHLTWWQSANGEEDVSIRLNLEAEFHFTHLIMKFKTFRPAAMVIERSSDFGRSWRPYRYFAYNCSRTFPWVPAHALRNINDVICQQRYSDIEPSSHGEVIYKVLDPAVKVQDPYSLDIQELLRITSLRINFTKLHTLGDNLLDRRADVLQKYYYALYELVLRGSCFCYGHASECAPMPGVNAREDRMIHGRCVCNHNTQGLNCERCRDFYNDLPWQPAEANNPHTCKECTCNDHSSQCHFDMAVFLATGNTSGGVCDDCLHNTMGRNCDMCKPFYYQDPSRDIRDPRVCVACDCDPVGSLEGGVCDSHTDPDAGVISGQCRCKASVKGARCDSCREGHYGLSQDNPQGCQPCHCDSRGIIMLGTSSCDQISGDCSCKRYVTGRYCDHCLPEYWGLSNDLAGCRPCDCDFGGSYNNRCIVENGQCDCRRHLIGRQCTEVQSGYFCSSLDFYTYEAETASGHSPDDPDLPGKARPQAEVDCVEHLNNQLRRHRRHRHNATAHQERAALRRIRQLQQTPDVRVVHRERTLSPLVSWTGPGFARVKDGAGLVFTLDNIPYAMDYHIMIRYEPESTENWEAIVSVMSVSLPSSTRCGNLLPTEQLYTIPLTHTSRYVSIPRPFCFEPGNRYVLAVRFQRHAVSHRHLTAFILIDSLVLIPKYAELPGFEGNAPGAEQRQEEMIRYMCVDSFLTTPTPVLAEMCSKLICSISAILHDGALACQCDPQGSLSADCSKVGGQCRCKPNVIGRRCDQCAPGTYGFGSYGCIACDCHSQGSLGQQCDPVWGQCVCRVGAAGRQCSSCQGGQWGFPSCQPCHCNGHADSCHPHSGECLSCRDHTTGHLCDRCVNGFFGNPVLGVGEHCRPCPCPGNPDSGHFHGDSCHTDQASNQIICNCRQGYTGPRCDRCSPGYYGNPEQAGGECRPCQCSGNIDPQDPGSCDPGSGQCLRCLYNTDGPACSHCRRSYYGNALAQDCRRCTCVRVGTVPSHCSEAGCQCDAQTGACPCRPNVEGHACDRCSPQHWNYGAEGGCQPCACHPHNALATHCNMFSGQCHCAPGFGGSQCTECEQFHWGDPRVQCEECSCHPLGSESPQCDRASGACVCREGAAGRRCDLCARGFSGSFPHCLPCHPCFQLWDDALCQIKRDLEHVQVALRRLEQSGAEGGGTPGLGHARVRELERKLESIQDVVRHSDSERIYLLIGQTIDDLRAEIALTDGRLMGVAQELNGTAEHDGKLRRSLSLLEAELKDVNTTVAQRRGELENYLTSGTADQLERVRGYYRQSQQAEQRCVWSVGGGASPVVQSQSTQQQTQTLLQQRREAFLKTTAAHKKSLEDLQKKNHDLDKKVLHLSHKVCGGHGNSSCPDSPCGGAGCRDDHGQRLCGGAGCNGTASVAMATVKQVDGVTDRLMAASEELQGMAKKLQEIVSLTREVKDQTRSTLDKATSRKTLFDSSNQNLKHFIQKIRDFLTEEGAKPENIEKVALQVLSISLPVNRTSLDAVVQNIRDNIANLTDVEKVFNSTAQQLQQAQDLLSRAKDARVRAEGVKDSTSATRRALNMSELAVQTAAQALTNALHNLNTTRNNTAMVEQRLQGGQGGQMEMMERLARLSEGLEALRNQSQKTRGLASDALGRAANATHAASGLEQRLNETEQHFRDLKMKVDSLDGAPGGAETINQMKKEAESLLNKANKGIETLRKLERKFRNNEQRLLDQQSELADLERNATNAREDIREQVHKYSNC
ncbi:LOW QUALITY PROTEIN: laminin subunit beta-2 [Hypomesus transpacificus]|uniref:LOW QUALITY PROTEIN: laminin subunit beta-2 n=1 Tax=Hypomesus transpacificus TaxID=137520 RepID=UPI001F07333C|nr:LOW QUALITY PROTEIN: laminin subunit beta-2 [Hypomesus transpacificus]